MFKYITLIFALFLLASCEDVIEVDVDSQDKDLYIVEAKITSLNEPWVFVSKTLSVTVDQPYSGISNLNVTITDDEEPNKGITLVEDVERKGYYTVPENLSYLGIPGRTYKLVITTPENITLSATETLYPVEPIDSIHIGPSMRGDSLFLGVYTYGNEPEGLGSFYKWDIYVNDAILKMNNADYLAFASDEFVDGNYIYGLEIFTDFHDPNMPEERLLQLNDTIYVNQTSTTEFAYYFYYQMSNQAQSGGLFSVPPANIPGNFTASNGEKVVGLFTAHDISTSNSIVIDESIEALLNTDF